ncbi:glycosyltransferase family 2 protein [Mucilaginibacter aquaedulcis]|uniref:glycosyltransferase family 2 protein n=1 Tax=Mucilaginibacter aquaedulcis TaxID=1187081 RepID=UPI0025B5951B|nr:glycosyltransferase family 2 protein [Mucilaginibacter aquaedulcis]MDN3547637.1 glycosyltransferase family 2 protein [Mucilaginibacter aquaedulcis]
MNQNNILVSIIIATYNAEDHIGNALASLIPNINESTEIIIVDGLSKDNTLNIISEYKNHIAKVCSEKDKGIYDAMNKGVSMASGKFILFLGADDKLLININELTPLLLRDDTIYYGDVLINNSNVNYGGKFNLAKLLNKNICHQSILYPRSVLAKYPFDLRYKLMADYVLNMKLWSTKNINFSYIDRIIAQYSLEGESSRNKDLVFQKDSIKMVYDLFGFYGLAIKSFNPVRRIFKF